MTRCSCSFLPLHLKRPSTPCCRFWHAITPVSEAGVWNLVSFHRSPHTPPIVDNHKDFLQLPITPVCILLLLWSVALPIWLVSIATLWVTCMTPNAQQQLRLCHDLLGNLHAVHFTSRKLCEREPQSFSHLGSFDHLDL